MAEYESLYFGFPFLCYIFSSALSNWFFTSDVKQNKDTRRESNIFTYADLSNFFLTALADLKTATTGLLYSAWILALAGVLYAIALVVQDYHGEIIKTVDDAYKDLSPLLLNVRAIMNVLRLTGTVMILVYDTTAMFLVGILRAPFDSDCSTAFLVNYASLSADIGQNTFLFLRAWGNVQFGTVPDHEAQAFFHTVRAFVDEAIQFALCHCTPDAAQSYVKKLFAPVYDEQVDVFSTTSLSLAWNIARAPVTIITNGVQLFTEDGSPRTTFFFDILDVMLDQTAKLWHLFYKICDNWIQGVGHALLGKARYGDFYGYGNKTYYYTVDDIIPNPTRLLLILPNVVIQALRTILFGMSRFSNFASAVSGSDISDDAQEILNSTALLRVVEQDVEIFHVDFTKRVEVAHVLFIPAKELLTMFKISVLMLLRTSDMFFKSSVDFIFGVNVPDEYGASTAAKYEHKFSDLDSAYCTMRVMGVKLAPFDVGASTSTTALWTSIKLVLRPTVVIDAFIRILSYSETNLKPLVEELAEVNRQFYSKILVQLGSFTKVSILTGYSSVEYFAKYATLVAYLSNSPQFMDVVPNIFDLSETASCLQAMRRRPRYYYDQWWTTFIDVLFSFDFEQIQKSGFINENCAKNAFHNSVYATGLKSYVFATAACSVELTVEELIKCPYEDRAVCSSKFSFAHAGMNSKLECVLNDFITFRWRVTGDKYEQGISIFDETLIYFYSLA